MRDKIKDILKEIFTDDVKLSIDEELSKLYEYIPNETKCEDVSVILNKKGECIALVCIPFDCIQVYLL